MLYIPLPDIIQRFRKAIQFDRLRQEQINARNKCLLLSLCRPQPRQRDDSSWGDILTTFKSSDLASGFKAIHDRHGDVHEDHFGLGSGILWVAEGGRFVGFKGFETVGCCEAGVAVLFGVCGDEAKVHCLWWEELVLLVEYSTCGG